MAGSTSSTSVVIVEDDPRFREAFAAAVSAAPDLWLAGVASDVQQGIALLDQIKPRVALIDVGLPGGSGIDLIRHAQQRLHRCDVMVVTVFADDQVVFDCIEAGATGYLLKDASGVDLVAQVRMLLDGGSPITPRVARRILTRLSPRAPAPDRAEASLLSARECTVLQLCAKGYSYPEISQLLNLSPHTVEAYVKRTYRKLQVHSKTEAVYEGRKLGLLAD